jgi:uncharacterized membrane protein YphA (DoxX/SURF4 family)
MLKISRYLVGILFIISGLIKANDPTGFAIKLEEYFVVFGMEWLSFAALSLSVLICSLEIVLGVALLFGIKPKPVAWLLLLMIIFFTWLTGYSAITNKVTDCGCFGDAIKLTPWQSFTKDVILMVFITYIFVRRSEIQASFGKKTSAAILTLASVLSIFFGVYCVAFLPVVDFLPYKIGNNIPELMQVPEGAPRDSFETRMYYEKDGKTEVFTMQNYPWQDSTWKWVKTESVLIREGYKPKVKDLHISDAEGNEYTEDVLVYPDYQLIVIAYDLPHTNRAAFKKINELSAQLQKNNKVRTLGLTATNAEQVQALERELNMPFTFYFCDATTLKTMVRANPGVILMRGGVVVNKWHSNALPAYEEFVSELKN